MEPSLYQPDSLDAPVVKQIGPSGERPGVPSASDSYDWQYEQKPLLARWDEPTPDHFGAADGDRERFVERLAQRGGISIDDASANLTAFESKRSIRWRASVSNAELL